MTAPTLVHAIGDRSGGRVQLRTCTMEPYAYVSCEHPAELLDAIRLCMTRDSWLECDDGRIVQLRYVVQARVADAR